MSIKAALVVLWACLIAGAAVASENHRLCTQHADTEFDRLHKEVLVVEEETDVLITVEVDVTN